jgi:hypothetical protein
MGLALLCVALATIAEPSAVEPSNPEPMEAEPSVEQTQVDRSPKVWEAYVGVMGGMRLADPAGGGALSVGLNRKFGFVRPELMVGLGAYAGPVEMLTVIRIGARVEWPWESRFKPYLWVAFAHNHESGIADVEKNPVTQVFGLSENGVHHRSGAEGGLGFTVALPRILTDLVLGRIGARLTFTNFFGDPYPPRYLDLTVTAGVMF